MCGLIYVKRLDGEPACKVALKRYHSQSKRGKLGFGYIPVEDGHVRRVERFTEEKDFLEALAKETTTEILIHHRAPTSTENLIGTTHPVFVSDKMFKHNYYVIHNGTLRNESILKEKHEKLGLEYVTAFQRTTVVEFKNHRETTHKYATGFLDSEALAKEFALYIEGHKTELDFRGSCATIIFQTTKKGKIVAIYYARNKERELVVENVVSKKKKKHKGNYCVLKSEGNGVGVDDGFLFRVDYETGKSTKIEVDIGDNFDYHAHRQVSVGYDTRNITDRRLELMGRNKEIKDWDLRRKIDEEREDKNIRHLVFNADMPVKNVHEANTAHLEARIELIEEEKINLTTDRGVWQDIVNSSSDDVEVQTAHEEVMAINDQYKELLREARDIENELISRYSTDGVPSPFMESGRIIEM